MSTTTRIPLPPHLDAPWEQPGDEHGFWAMDRMHFPNALPLLEDGVVRLLYDGMNVAAEQLCLPVRSQVRRFWTHHYMVFAPLQLPEEELHALGEQAEQALGAALGSFARDWAATWLPEVQATIQDWETVDVASMPAAALAPYLDRTIERARRMCEIHFLVAVPCLFSMNMFHELYGDLFGGEDALESFTLLAGIENTTVASGRELWRLSRVILDAPRLRPIFEEQAAAEIVPALRALPEGQAFLADLQDYLEEYGRRGQSWGIVYPTWLEDSTPVIRTLKDYVAQPDRNLELEQAAQVAERDQAIAAARERLAGYPEAVRNQFEFFLKAAHAGVVLSEDHGYWIDFRGLAGLRRVLLGLGGRLADGGAIDRADDVFHLTLAELRAALLERGDLRGLVAERKAELARYAGVEMPPAVGTQPPGPPPDNPISRTIGRFFGAPPQPSSEPGVLRGAGGSAGVARGRARVARSLAEAASIVPGDILVAETTAPPWTPLFGTVAAVVTDTGGILSHCAVVAREYRIPAVVGVGMATALIRDGQLIEVDGDRGLVRIIDEG